MEEEDDVVEIKKAMATGSVNRDNSTAISSGTPKGSVHCSPIGLFLLYSPAHCMLLPRIHPHDGREQGTRHH